MTNAPLNADSIMDVNNSNESKVLLNSHIPMNNSKESTDYSDPVDFKVKQAEFAAYIRDPLNNPIPADVKADRMLMYRELFFNNINSFLSGNFPVLNKLLTESEWLALTQDFFAIHECKTPHFSEIAEEFLYYLEHERDTSTDLPFTLELAHYEWVEMALSISKESALAVTNSPQILTDIEDDKNTPVSASTANPTHKTVALDHLLTKKIKVSPLAWHLAYQYPVHKIGPGYTPLTSPEQATFLIVYRNHEDDVNFLEITPITYRLLEIISEQESVITRTCLEQIAQETQHPNPEIIINGGLQILNDLYEKGIIGLAC
jgi:Uncharacterized protein conserved in bacteria